MTLVNGRTFTVADRAGEIRSAVHGTIFEDHRILSRLEVRTGGTAQREQLAVSKPTPFQSVVVSRPEIVDGAADHLVVHRQWIGRGCRHDVEVINTGRDTVNETVSISFDSDFAHLFDVKSGRVSERSTELSWSGVAGHLSAVGEPELSIAVNASPGGRVDTDAKTIVWTVQCPPRGSRTVSLSFEPFVDGAPAGLMYPLDSAPAQARPAQRLEAWRQTAPALVSDDARLTNAFETALSDISSLRIFDPQHPDRTVVAAGAPWFMTLFGRDSLITSWMMLPFAPELALGVLRSLGDLQGTTAVPSTEEEPGKILHELRREGGDDAFSRRGRYYGTVDATPLYIMLAGEAHRWRHLDHDTLHQLWPSIRAAIGWLVASLDRDPGGWLSYRRSTNVGLINQGWKDSWDGINAADGSIPSGPIALSEVQGYAYAALRAGARLARAVGGDDLDADALDRRAEVLRERYDASFWNATEGTFLLGLAGGTPIDSMTTNPGHAIWSGIADQDKANRYFDRAMDELFNGWGLRTLSPNCARYDPMSYHNGSVWPHDTSLVAAGASLVGRQDVVTTLVHAALDMTDRFGGRPPELFSGLDRSVIDTPVSYPDTCSPQAWASASKLLDLRSIMLLDPPAKPSDTDPVYASYAAPDFAIRRLDGVRIGAARHSIGLRRLSADRWRTQFASDASDVGSSAE